MAEFTEAQRHAIRFYTGWSEGWSRTFQRVESAMQRIQDLYPAAFAHITNPLDGSPAGLLAQLDAIWVQIFGVTTGGRLKALAVGPITLNPDEIRARGRVGAVLASQLCQILGIPKARDVFSDGGVDRYAGDGNPSTSGGGSNYRGKA